MSWTAVAGWRDALRADSSQAPTCGLSPEGRDLVLTDALDALTDEALAAAAARLGPPFARATVILPRTVCTAGIEWAALLLGNGTRVTLKPPAASPGLAPWLAGHARRRGLPLDVDASHAAVGDAELVVAMGGDQTLRAIEASLAPGARLLGFGHRFSAAWWPSGADAADGLARDMAAHDGRGCMTPALVFTDDLGHVLRTLPAALGEAERHWPRGPLTDAEHVGLRTRRMLTQVVGEVVQGERWAIHALPLSAASTEALPRAVQVVVATPAEAAAWLADHAAELSTVGLGGPLAVPESARACELGWMQRPPLIRRHDGVDHLAMMGR